MRSPPPSIAFLGFFGGVFLGDHGGSYQYQKNECQICFFQKHLGHNRWVMLKGRLLNNRLRIAR